MAAFSIGIDFGTLSGRVLIVDLQGKIVGTSIISYTHGVISEKLPFNEDIILPKDFALQHPNNYLDVLYQGIPKALDEANITSEDITGIGITFTSSTMMAVDNHLNPLCLYKEHESNPHAWVKLWKHHGAQKEAEEIYNLAKCREEKWLQSYGNHVSAEWFLPKCLETFYKAPKLYDEVNLFIEAGDWIVSILTGEVIRSNCSLGFKAFWNEVDGFPEDFLTTLDYNFGKTLKSKLSGKVMNVGNKAGNLTKQMAKKIGLSSGIPVAVSIIDAHSSLLGIGAFEDKQLTMVMGTSTCHLMLNEKKRYVTGISGVVKDAIIPGLYAYEAGQSAVGDLFGWYSQQIPEAYTIEANNKNISVFQLLEKKAKTLKPGENGLLALDWFNGNRSILSNFDLSGMILGMSLDTTPEEIYRSLLEASAFGAKVIIETYEKAGLNVEKVFACGGLPQKNDVLMQIYADVLNKKIQVSATNHASGIGAAILGAVAGGSFKNLNDASNKMKQPFDKIYEPIKDNVRIYGKLFEIYKQIHDLFGVKHPHLMEKVKNLH